MTYEPVAGDSILLALSGLWMPPLGDEIVLGGAPEEPEPRTLSPDTAIPWDEMARLNRLLGAGWQRRRFVARSFSPIYRDLPAKERRLDSVWERIGGKDCTAGSSWRKAQRTLNYEGRYGWRRVVRKDHGARQLWDDTDHRPDRVKPIYYAYPPPMDRRYRLAWEDDTINDIIKGAPWIGRLPVKDIDHRTTWGPKFYYEICWRHYEPPDGDQIRHDIHLSITQVGDRDHIDLYFDQYTYDRRCVWREPSGWRDAYFYRPPKTAPWALAAKVYVMIHTAYLTRVADGAPIDTTSLTLSTDWDSVCWSLRAAIGSDAHLALLEPTVAGPIAVDAEINGHTWRLQVDRTTASRAFTGKSRSIEGRSVSAQLGAPAAEIRTYTENQQRTAVQLMEQELQGTGWSIDMDATDWLVPAGALSYRDQTPLAVIKSIADAAGAMVQSHMSDQVLLIQPRYQTPPWDWPTATAAIVIPAEMIDKLDSEWDERPFFNAVFLSGSISARVIRQGSAGDLIAPMVTDPLITAVEAARQRGIAVLAASGRWQKYRLELPVFAPPLLPGVLLPGTLIQVDDGVISWKGLVTAVSVTANWGKNGLKVRQTIDVERYRGN
ncbi:hypothetical protein [Desulfofustis glycolicus]|uniref:Phage tail protein n=1 Tax=Desulfofustis glycolicus DSM 9705 TaxID=1121409 RepID=A0A1M5S3Z7_9BACT|nr:hypothetical protein [Desulfofustis glycolicus]SHH33165.1 hypothetical protein SAMN02745124_00148 [Desulfofustis glycolicus DSM 9705]